eukprot:SAG11_NODE_9267_length_927_cov_1.353865_1_plen_294_part_10
MEDETRTPLHPRWLAQLEHAVENRRIVRDSATPYSSSLRNSAGYPSWVKERQLKLVPGVYTFELFIEPPKDASWTGIGDQSLLLDLSLWLSPSNERVVALTQERIELSASSYTTMSGQFKARCYIPEGQTGDFLASYRTESTTEVHVRHYFRRHTGPHPQRALSRTATEASTPDTMLHPKKNIHILSMDGGGVRGIVELMILKELMDRVNSIIDHRTNRSARPCVTPEPEGEGGLADQNPDEQFPLLSDDDASPEPGAEAQNTRQQNRVHEFFDMIGGTSTGGLFALSIGLAGI